MPAAIPTFAELARADFQHRKAAWRNAKHAAQRVGTLEEFAFPRLGDRPVDGLTTDDVFRVLAPIWHDKPTTAKRLRQRIGAVLAVAVAKGHRSLPYGDVAYALAKVRESNAHRSTVLALEFLVLIAARAGEVRLATWRAVP